MGDLEMDQERALRDLKALALSSLLAWRLDCKEIALIKFRENAVFKVTASEGRRFALRAHRAGYHSDDELRSELQWMAALQQSGVAVPIVVPTPAGELFIRASLPGTDESVQVDLFEWIDGDQLGTAEGGLGHSAKDVASTYQTIGKIAARLHNHGTTWQLPKGFRRHAWDADGLVGEQPFWGRFWELESLTAEQRRLLLAAREIVRAELNRMSRSPEFAASYGLIHADFVPENLLVSDGKVQLLDFDDAGFGWHLFEIATALYFIRSDPNYGVARDALIAGYREHRALSETVLAKLPVLMMARGLTYVGWVHTRKHSEAARQLAAFVTELACDLAAQFVGTHGQAETHRAKGAPSTASFAGDRQ